MSKIRQLKDLGFWGLLKSVYYSYRHTSSLSKLVFTSQVITEISSNTTFNIQNRFTIGTGRRGASHPKIGRSKFSTAPNSEVAHTGDKMAIVGPASVVHVEGKFAMGDSFVNSHSRIICGDEITIGDGVAIAWNVEILDDDRHDLVVNGSKKPRSAPINIEDNVWIGHNVTIQKGVTVNEGSVIASNSVVTSDVPSNCLVAGTPAQVIQESVTWGSDA